MNQNFQNVVAFFKPIPTLTHRQDIMRLYRRALRTLASWAECREVFNEHALLIQAEFQQNKNASPALAAKLLREGQERLLKATHPDPYIAAYMPGGTLFMRNPAIPMEALFPDGIPDTVSRRRLNIDMSNLPDDQPFADKAFVDSASKTYWIDK